LDLHSCECLLHRCTPFNETNSIDSIAGHLLLVVAIAHNSGRPKCKVNYTRHAVYNLIPAWQAYDAMPSLTITHTCLRQPTKGASYSLVGRNVDIQRSRLRKPSSVARGNSGHPKWQTSTSSPSTARGARRYAVSRGHTIPRQAWPRDNFIAGFSKLLGGHAGVRLDHVTAIARLRAPLVFDMQESLNVFS